MCLVRGRAANEIKDRAKPLEDTTLTMAALLDRILAFRAAWVIGYSGWNNHVFMMALKRRLLSPLPFNLYWFCFRRSNVANLPLWLQNHADVYFVVPPEEIEETIVASREEVDGAKHDQVVEADTAPTGNTRSEPTLDATVVLDALVRELKADTPLFAKNPLAFYASQLRDALPQEDVAEGDVYSLRNLVARVERAMRKEAEDAKTAKENEERMDNMRDALGRAQYDEAVKHAQEIELASLDEEQLRELLKAMDTSSRAMPDNAPLKPNACDLVVSCYDVLTRKKRLTQADSIQATVVGALNIRGNLHFALRRYQEAIEVYNQALTRFEDATDPLVLESLGCVTTNKILSLRNLLLFQDAVDASDAWLQKYAGSVELRLLNSKFTAYSFKGQALVSLKRYHEALEAFAHATTLADGANNLTDYTKNELATMKKVEAQAQGFVEATAVAANPPVVEVAASTGGQAEGASEC